MVLSFSLFVKRKGKKIEKRKRDQDQMRWWPRQRGFSTGFIYYMKVMTFETKN